MNKLMITVFADQYLYKIASCLPKSIDLTLFDPAEGLPEDLQRARGLLIRTVNAVTPETLPEIPQTLSFIGTGSSGTDHVDQNYLKENNITFADAAGCNARSVAEYIATALLLWSEHERLRNLSVGIVGLGHVGSQVQTLLEKLQIPTVCYDPPRACREPSFRSASLDQVLQADILTFHTPLTTGGDHPTRHWLDRELLSDHSFDLIINTARGGVVDEHALIESHDRGHITDFILDVWEEEPEFRLHTAAKAYLKTPHIAGYSIQAKLNASKFVADALLAHFNLDQSSQSHQPDHSVQRVGDKSNQSSYHPGILPDLSVRVEDSIDHFSSLSELLKKLHPIGTYQSKLDQIVTGNRAVRGKLFNKLRAEFPLRSEFGHMQLPESYFNRFPILKKLGFGNWE